MKYYIPTITPKADRIKKLNLLHDACEKRADDFDDLIISFANKNSENAKIGKKYYLFNLLTNANQIMYSFGELKEAKKSLEDLVASEFETKKKQPAMFRRYESIATASILVFFFNAKSFLELIKKNTKIKIDTDFNELLADVTFIRDHLAHSYEKERGTDYLSTKRMLVAYRVSTGDLECLELDDAETGEEIGEIQFSMNAFYFSIRDIFKQLVDNSNLLK